MNRSFSFLLAVVLLACVASSRAQQIPPANSVYGAYPTNYKEIVTNWLNSALVDPKSVKIDWLGEPHPGELAVGQGKQVNGFLVDFTVNARNIFGAYTGAQRHTALVRDGQVVTATGFLAH